MPRRKTVRIRKRRAPLSYRVTHGRGRMRVYKRGRVRKIRNGRAIRQWMDQKAKPWIGRGKTERRKFMKDFYKGFSSVIRPIASIGGPILDALGMPEFGIPLSIAGGIM